MGIVRSHDGLFRFVFGDPEQAGELLRSNLPPAVAAAIDWSTVRRVAGSFVDAELQHRHADLLFAAQLDGNPALLFVLFEHKSSDDRFTALQLLRYVVRVWDDWLRQNPEAIALPLVLPFVVHHGDAPWSAPRSLRALVSLDGVRPDVASFVLALQPDLAFLLDDLAARSEDEIAARRLSAAGDLSLRFLQFLRGCDLADAAGLIGRWQNLMRRLLDDRRGNDVLSALYHWFLAGTPNAEQVLHAVMAHIDDPQTRQTMKSSLDQLLDRGFAQGLERGLQEGREEGLLRGQRELLRRQMTMRFGAIPIDVAARLAAGSSAELECWSAAILTAGSLTDVFGGA